MLTRHYTTADYLITFLGNSNYGLSYTTTPNEVIFAWADNGATKLHIPKKGGSYITRPVSSENSIWNEHDHEKCERCLYYKRLNEFPILKGLKKFLDENELLVNSNYEYVAK